MPILHNWKCKYVPNATRNAKKTILNGYRPAVYNGGATKYVGYWTNNKRDGFGAIHQTNDLIYDGQWFNNLRHGQGAIRKRNPENGKFYRIFVGQWENGKKNGEGKKFYKTGIYFGYWVNDLREGLGFMWYKNGSMYVGEWKADKYHGAGALFQVDGNRYEGFFENGLKEGEGTFYHNKTGQIQKGMWKENICRTSIMQDEFRNQVVNPTEYSITKQQIANPDKVVRDAFRIYQKMIDDMCLCFNIDEENICGKFYQVLPKTGKK